MTRFFSVKLCLVLTIAYLFILGSLGFINNAYAYNASGAVSYANTWASNTQTLRNSNYPSFSSDCTNFVSQCIHDPAGANKAFDTVGSSEYFKWYCYDRILYWDYTTTWSVASHFYNYLRENPAGSNVGTWGVNPSNDISAVPGDILFYDWDNNGSKDHAGIMVGNGTDPVSGWVGDLQNQHTTDRKNAIWHLRPYNSKWSTTVFAAMRPY